MDEVKDRNVKNVKVETPAEKNNQVEVENDHQKVDHPVDRPITKRGVAKKGVVLIAAIITLAAGRHANADSIRIDAISEIEHTRSHADSRHDISSISAPGATSNFLGIDSQPSTDILKGIHYDIDAIVIAPDAADVITTIEDNRF